MVHCGAGGAHGAGDTCTSPAIFSPQIPVSFFPLHGKNLHQHVSELILRGERASTSPLPEKSTFLAAGCMGMGLQFVQKEKQAFSLAVV